MLYRKQWQSTLLCVRKNK